jgi:two-component system phosphate regulon response regulator PhoB
MAVNKKLKTCLIDGREIKLRKKEFEILALLLENRDRIFSREEILKKIWPNEVIVLDRVVDVNITRLRQAIGDFGKHIITRSGYGYGFIDK